MCTLSHESDALLEWLSRGSVTAPCGCHSSVKRLRTFGRDLCGIRQDFIISSASNRNCAIKTRYFKKVVNVNDNSNDSLSFNTNFKHGKRLAMVHIHGQKLSQNAEPVRKIHPPRNPPQPPFFASKFKRLGPQPSHW